MGIDAANIMFSLLGSACGMCGKSGMSMVWAIRLPASNHGSLRERHLELNIKLAYLGLQNIEVPNTDATPTQGKVLLKQLL